MIKEYYRPETVEEAITLLHQAGIGAKVIAGGTDLVPLMKAGKIQPTCLVSLRRISELFEAHFDEKTGLSLGAAVTLSSLVGLRKVRERYPMLMEAALTVGSVQVRNLGTVLGNLCHAAPSADMAPPLLALDAKVEVASVKGRRVVNLWDFFLAPNQTCVAPEELAVRILVPPPAPASGGSYQKLGWREAMEIAVVSAAAVVRMDDGLCRFVRIALGAVAPTPVRAMGAEEKLSGERFAEENIKEASKASAEESRPITDFRASAAYRRAMVKVLTARALKAAAQRSLKR